MIKKLYLIFFGVLTFAMLACSDDSVTGSSDVELSSSSVDMPSSSSVELESSSSSSENSSILCKTSGNWGYDGCIVKKPSGRGDLWSNGDSVVSTKAYVGDTSKFGKRAGEWFFEKDSVDEKQAEILWTYGGLIPEFKGILDAVVLLDGSYNSFINVGFYTAGFDSDGAALSVDVSNWNGLCVLYRGSITPTLQLDLGDSINKKLGNVLPSVALESKEESQCFEWKDFKQSDSENAIESISGEDAAKHVEKIVFHFQIEPYEDFDGHESFTILAVGTNRDE